MKCMCAVCLDCVSDAGDVDLLVEEGIGKVSGHLTVNSKWKTDVRPRARPNTAIPQIVALHQKLFVTIIPATGDLLSSILSTKFICEAQWTSIHRCCFFFFFMPAWSTVGCSAVTFVFHVFFNNDAIYLRLLIYLQSIFIYMNLRSRVVYFVFSGER